MNMFAHLKSKPEMLSANRSLAAASTTCSVNPAFPASTLDAASLFRVTR